MKYEFTMNSSPWRDVHKMHIVSVVPSKEWFLSSSATWCRRHLMCQVVFITMIHSIDIRFDVQRNKRLKCIIQILTWWGWHIALSTPWKWYILFISTILCTLSTPRKWYIHLNHLTLSTPGKSYSWRPVGEVQYHLHGFLKQDVIWYQKSTSVVVNDFTFALFLSGRGKVENMIFVLWTSHPWETYLHNGKRNLKDLSHDGKRMVRWHHNSKWCHDGE